MTTSPTSREIAERFRSKFSGVLVTTSDEDGGKFGSVRVVFGPHALVPFDTLTEIANHLNLETDTTHFEWISFTSFFESSLTAEPGAPTVPSVSATLKWRILTRKEMLRRKREGDRREESEDESPESDLGPWETELLRVFGVLDFKIVTEQMLQAHFKGRVTVEELEGIKAASKSGSIVSLVQGEERGTLELIVRHHAAVPFPPLSDHQRHCASASRGYRYL